MGTSAGTVKARNADCRLALLSAAPAAMPPSTKARKMRCASGSPSATRSGAAPQSTPLTAAPTVKSLPQRPISSGTGAERRKETPRASRPAATSHSAPTQARSLAGAECPHSTATAIAELSSTVPCAIAFRSNRARTRSARTSASTLCAWGVVLAPPSSDLCGTQALAPRGASENGDVSREQTQRHAATRRRPVGRRHPQARAKSQGESGAIAGQFLRPGLVPGFRG